MSPRTRRKRESPARVRPATVRPPRSHNQAPRPAVSAKAGAQRWVIQRVRKTTGVVSPRSVGEPVMAPAWTKSRT
jgi:hypothetical protein